VDNVRTELVDKLKAKAQEAIEKSEVQPDSDRCFGYPSRLILELTGGEIMPTDQAQPRMVELMFHPPQIVP
jgi:hypothetical protein